MEASKDVKSAAKVASTDPRVIAQAKATGNYDVAMAKADGDHKVALEKCLTVDPALQQTCKTQADSDYDARTAGAKALRVVRRQ